MDCESIFPEILVEQLQKVVLCGGIFRNRVLKSYGTLCGCQLHGFGKLQSGLSSPYRSGESIYFARLLHEPVEKTYSLLIDIRTDDGIA